MSLDPEIAKMRKFKSPTPLKEEEENTRGRQSEESKGEKSKNGENVIKN